MSPPDAAPLKNIAIVGAGGRIGGFIANALIEQGQHHVTAITRPDSTAELPSSIHDVKKADYSSHSSLVEALTGQDFLVISMNVMAPKDSQTRLIDAAVEAGVRWIMPNEYGGSWSSSEQMGKDDLLGPGILAIRKYIEEKGVNWVSCVCGFWYEFSLSGAEIRYGFDFKKRSLTIFDDGKVKHTVSTWPQVGRAVAKFLALPVSGSSQCLEDWKNKQLCISSFTLSQHDMFDSVLRVTKTKESDWTITHEDTQKRLKRGQEMMKQGNFAGFGIALYVSVFFPDGRGDNTALNQNDKLGLPKEDLDEATKVAVEYVESGKSKAWSM
ncbi:hypothetical protein LTR10_007113 [Elasticomyces elasticus]|nr:hypothetical protein LTR10_007113 [Elasticomyces elasticus]KAK4978930.1 hypothetical protein LTR42_001430 [Elasticomyces elasticus]